MAKEKKSIFEELKINPPSTFKMIAGIMWCIGAVIIMEFLLSDEPFEMDNRVLHYYLITVVPFFLIYQDKQCLIRLFCKRKSIWLYPYIAIMAFLCFGIFGRSLILGSYGFDPLVREFTYIFYCILSIPLTVIVSNVFWSIYAVAIYLNTILYFLLLQEVSYHSHITMFYIAFNVVVVILSCVISLYITRVQFKKVVDNYKPK